jgi:hypothetical protein
MGYACPVCGDPQADAIHLANHLAFTALLRGGDHEAWLDEHVPEWEDHGESWLAERVVEGADDEEFPQVFVDTTGQTDDHAHDHADHDHAHDHGHGREAGHTNPSEHTGPTDAAVEDAMSQLEGDDGDLSEIIDEARELTRKRREGNDEDSETE